MELYRGNAVGDRMNELEHQLEIDEILQYIHTGLDEKTYKIQEIQTNHRLKLIKKWHIESGQKVLEIGSGQGDTTVALAHTVGGNGHITAVDIAPPEYGAPFTLGESMAKLKATPFGNIIEPYFSTNLLEDSSILNGKFFDAVVFAHCSWYFNSISEFIKLLEIIKRHTKKILYAEWNLFIRIPEQMDHFLAVMLQGILATFYESRMLNVKTLIGKQDILRIAEELHLAIEKDGTIDSGIMQDGRWEIDIAKELITGKDIDDIKVNKKTKDLLLTLVHLIGNNKKALDTYWCVLGCE
jgi:SAM-dependent methyltransferase